MPNKQKLTIREFNMSMMSPNKPSDYNGVKVVIIGKPGTGKTTLIKRMLYEKSNIIPIGTVFSGTEDSNHTFSQHFPSTLIYNNIQLDRLSNAIKRQKIAKKFLENPWGLILLDDCTDDPKILTNEIFINIFKMGRHYNLFFILSLQYVMDIKPVIRSTIDFVFIFREPNIRNRKILFENYASIVGDFNLFCQILDTICENHTALVIYNSSQSNKLEDCVFYYQAAPVPPFKFGCDDSWIFDAIRKNPKYKENLL